MKDDRPAWYRCIRSDTRLFKVGNVYEVEYDRDGNAHICTEQQRICARLPHADADFEPHDPWASYRSERARLNRNWEDDMARAALGEESQQAQLLLLFGTSKRSAPSRKNSND